MSDSRCIPVTLRPAFRDIRVSRPWRAMTGSDRSAAVSARPDPAEFVRALLRRHFLVGWRPERTCDDAFRTCVGRIFLCLRRGVGPGVSRSEWRNDVGVRPRGQETCITTVIHVPLWRTYEAPSHTVSSRSTSARAADNSRQVGSFVSAVPWYAATYPVREASGTAGSPPSPAETTDAFEVVKTRRVTDVAPAATRYDGLAGEQAIIPAASTFTRELILERNRMVRAATPLVIRLPERVESQGVRPGESIVHVMNKSWHVNVRAPSGHRAALAMLSATKTVFVPIASPSILSAFQAMDVRPSPPQEPPQELVDRRFVRGDRSPVAQLSSPDAVAPLRSASQQPMSPPSRWDAALIPVMNRMQTSGVVAGETLLLAQVVRSANRTGSRDAADIPVRPLVPEALPWTRVLADVSPSNHEGFGARVIVSPGRFRPPGVPTDSLAAFGPSVRTLFHRPLPPPFHDRPLRALTAAPLLPSDWQSLASMVPTASDGDKAFATTFARTEHRRSDAPSQPPLARTFVRSAPVAAPTLQSPPASVTPEVRGRVLDAAPFRRGGLAETAAASPWSPADLNRLTDQVLKALDMRMIAHRERLGRGP